MHADAGVFFALWLQRPLRIAAAKPSGARLADAVARCIDLTRPGPVLELGAGTGSLTRGLVRAECRPEPIVALESDSASSHPGARANLIAVDGNALADISLLDGHQAPDPHHEG